MNVHQAEQMQEQWAAFEVAMTRAMMTASDVMEGGNDCDAYDLAIEEALVAWTNLVTLGVTEQFGHLVRQYVRLDRSTEENRACATTAS